MGTFNNQITKMFLRIADSLEILDENRFKINAYRKVARTVSSMDEDLCELVEKNSLSQIPGVGKDLSAKIIEFARTGKMQYYEEIRLRVPDQLVDLLEIREVGPKFIQTMVKRFGVTDITSLKKAIKNPEILEIRGIGRNKIQKITRAIEVFETGKQRMKLSEAYDLGMLLKERVEGVCGVLRVEFAGSLRRMMETVKNIDLTVMAEDVDKVVKGISDLFSGENAQRKNKNHVQLVTETGVAVDIRIAPPQRYGSLLQKFTGSSAHNARIEQIATEKGLEVGAEGIFRSPDSYFDSEEKLYQSLGFDYIAPELREDSGEIEAATRNNLPSLLQVQDLRGDLHTHSTWSDGANTIREMAQRAYDIGYEYIVITDHSHSSRIANGLSIQRLKEKKKEIERVNAEGIGIRVLMGSEVDILADGSLDYPDEVMSELDFVVASVHSHFSMEEQEMTKRICSALENPHVDAIGHPTGRLIGQREPYKVDIDTVISTAAKHDKALEINSSFKRLDLKDSHARKTITAGVKIIVSTDAHRTWDLDRIVLGVATARRGWVKKSDVINTYPLSNLLSWLASHNH